MWVTASTGVGDGGLQSEDVRARTLEDGENTFHFRQHLNTAPTNLAIFRHIISQQHTFHVDVIAMCASKESSSCLYVPLVFNWGFPSSLQSRSSASYNLELG